ncbi:hypothetical protein DPMN_021236 [Dreissena polymorpha]|uniref:Uncharacterized protein n=1 Tax=Dreissena polymorpha TaxID=45954 RepID=A0A9D4NI76_DREPO|nr:hypothetical protein DPMN_021236 [Dreissena polymorpha]
MEVSTEALKIIENSTNINSVDIAMTANSPSDLVRDHSWLRALAYLVNMVIECSVMTFEPRLWENGA